MDSVRYKDYYRTLLDLLDYNYSKGDIMLMHHRRMDNHKKWRKTYDKLPHDVQRREAKVHTLKIRENIWREYCDKKGVSQTVWVVTILPKKIQQRVITAEVTRRSPPVATVASDKMGHSNSRMPGCTFINTHKPTRGWKKVRSVWWMSLRSYVTLFGTFNHSVLILYRSTHIWNSCEPSNPNSGIPTICSSAYKIAEVQQS
jgi:hypothetical protein